MVPRGTGASMWRKGRLGVFQPLVKGQGQPVLTGMAGAVPEVVGALAVAVKYLVVAETIF